MDRVKADVLGLGGDLWRKVVDLAEYGWGVRKDYKEKFNEG